MDDFHGNRLRLIRVFNGWTMSDLAEKLDLSKQAIYKYEHGTMRPNLSTYVGMCQLLGVSMDFFSQPSITIEVKGDKMTCKSVG